MISQNSFYSNWTSKLYTSDVVARALPKNFYQGEDMRSFLNASRFDPTNARLVENLCIVDLDARLTNVSDESPTTWPESTIGIVVIAVSALSLLLFLICIICCICVCCLREDNEKE